MPTYLNLGGQICLDVLLHVVGDHLLLDNNVLVLARAEAGRDQLLGLFCVRLLALGLYFMKLEISVMR